MKFRTYMLGAVLSLASTTALAETYQVTITNMLSNASIAPVLITAASHDDQIFSSGYVTREAEDQIIAGDPMDLAEKIRDDVGGTSMIVYNTKNESDTLLAPGGAITFTMTTDAKALRVLARIVPTKSKKPDNSVKGVLTSLKEKLHLFTTKTTSSKEPDNYVTGVIDLNNTAISTTLSHWDLGYNEKSYTYKELDDSGTVNVVVVAK